MNSHREWELRERLVDVLEAASVGVVDPTAAAELLADYRGIWSREHRWRNPSGRRHDKILHIAGPVIACREYRRSCPGFIVDQRQTCSDCGTQLVRGRWAMFFAPGTPVIQYGTIMNEARETDLEKPCTTSDHGRER